MTRAEALAVFLVTVLSHSMLAAADDQADHDVEPTMATEVMTWSEQYYPLTVGNTLYLKAFEKEKPDEPLKIRVEIKNIEEKEGKQYYYYYAPEVDVRYLLRRDADGVYMRAIKFPFPLFKFSIKVEIKPELRFVRFPLEVGAKWEQETRGEARILFVPIKRSLKARFEIMKQEVLQTEAGEIEAFLVHAWISKGDEEPELEKFWYAKGIGFSRGDTIKYVTEIVGYRIFNEEERTWNEMLPENPEQYE